MPNLLRVCFRPLSPMAAAALLTVWLAACGSTSHHHEAAAPASTLHLVLPQSTAASPAPARSSAAAPDPSPADHSCKIARENGSVVIDSGDPGDPAAPEPASGYRPGLRAVTAKSYMVVAAHPLATRAGCKVLKAGGSAVDAAVAVQAVLGLVEPQSSSLAGGAFLMHYDAATKKVVSYDGRETAPAAATENYLRHISANAPRPPLPSARASGRSIGTPGVMRMLEMAHQDHGKLAWSALFDDGIQLATGGFKIGGRLANAISGAAVHLQRDAEAAAYFLDANGNAKPLGTVLTNPAYAGVLRALAQQGADAMYRGPIAEDIVAKIRTTQGADGSVITPGLTTPADLRAYQPKRREPVCATYRAYYVCSMSPPSSGGIAVVASLGILENFPLGDYAPTAIDLEGGKPSVMGVHLVSEANRLAYADRDQYVADTDFVPLPGNSPHTLINKPYLAQRAALIRMNRSMGTAQPGEFGTVPLGVSQTPENGTTHFSIVDKAGNVVSMTTTVESSMGSYHMARGMLLNNQLTDFSANPRDAQDRPVANRVEAGKRPRSSMAPTLVFRGAGPGDFVMATGSPGGGAIIQYVVKTLVGALDWGLDAQQATSMVDFGATNSPSTNVGGEHPHINTANHGDDDPLITGLRALGHTVAIGAQSSGTSTIMRVKRHQDWILSGGADPRREGLALGDSPAP